MGVFDRLLGQGISIENISIKRLEPKLKEWKVDLLILNTSRLCPVCRKFNGKVYSLYGWNKKYPKIPEETLGRCCPSCKKAIGACIYFEGISTPIKKRR